MWPDDVEANLSLVKAFMVECRRKKRFPSIHRRTVT